MLRVDKESEVDPSKANWRHMERQREREREKAYGCINVPRVYTLLYITVLFSSRSKEREGKPGSRDRTSVNYSFLPFSGQPFNGLEKLDAPVRLTFFTRSLFLVYEREYVFGIDVIPLL